MAELLALYFPDLRGGEGVVRLRVASRPGTAGSQVDEEMGCFPAGAAGHSAA